MSQVSNNNLIVDGLENFVAQYESDGDKWRAISYKKAIQTVIDCDEEIMSGEQAIKLPNIGKSIAAKIDEILTNKTIKLQSNGKTMHTNSNVKIVLDGDDNDRNRSNRNNRSNRSNSGNNNAVKTNDNNDPNIRVLNYRSKPMKKHGKKVNVVRVEEEESEEEQETRNNKKSPIVLRASRATSDKGAYKIYKKQKGLPYQKTEQDKVMKIFSQVWGAGPVACKTWYKNGARSLLDLTKSNIHLTKQQVLGLKYYKDFLQRIPRDQVDKIGKCVEKVIDSINKTHQNSKLKMLVCGSFRRGLKDSGDIDILVTNTNGKDTTGMLPKLVTLLTKYKILTNHLSLGNDKYMGICKMGGYFRRIDIKMIPLKEWYFALVYFTGSATLNKRMRSIAKRKQMKLNEKGLFDINSGKRYHAESEKEIFEMLGINYLKPTERKY